MRRERIVLERCLPPTRLPDDDLGNGEALERNICKRIENETRKRLNHVQAAAVVVEAALAPYAREAHHTHTTNWLSARRGAEELKVWPQGAPCLLSRLEQRSQTARLPGYENTSATTTGDRSRRALHACVRKYRGTKKPIRGAGGGRRDRVRGV
ncbi:hypothetical protein MTO96_001369 [Rhipicephalus appendiculatus]